MNGHILKNYNEIKEKYLKRYIIYNAYISISFI